MDLLELLDALDGYGLILTDDDLIHERLQELGVPLDTDVVAHKGTGRTG